MLRIAGGVYYEHCLEPAWSQLFGSGLRAAAAVAGLSRGGVCLHTYVGEGDRANLRANASGFRVALSEVPTARTVAFHYAHGLATPEVRPAAHTIRAAEPIVVSGPAVLRFGFLEGHAVVDGGRVVYDPQSPSDPRPFAENGSRAERLAIVCNAREAAALTGKRRVEDMAAALLADHGAEVAVVKQGSVGARVVTRTRSVTVPPFKTDRVWPIGSGDVFSAVFAACWAELKLDPVVAARRASAATAYYCDTRSLPLPRDVHRGAAGRLKPLKRRRPAATRRPTVYLAGPFFTMAERWLVHEARKALADQGLRVFSPYHDVGHGSADHVVPADLHALDRSDAVFAIVDGVDAGTLFEVGYARARRTPVVAFVQNEHPEALKMLEGTDCDITDDFVTAVYRTAWAALGL